MEDGYLGYPAWYGSRARWYPKKTGLGIGGEPLGEPNFWQVAYLDGARCIACRLVLFRY